MPSFKMCMLVEGKAKMLQVRCLKIVMFVRNKWYMECCKVGTKVLRKIVTVNFSHQDYTVE